MTSRSSSRNSKMHSQYSSKAGWCSPAAGISPVYRCSTAHPCPAERECVRMSDDSGGCGRTNQHRVRAELPTPAVCVTECSSDGTIRSHKRRVGVVGRESGSRDRTAGIAQPKSNSRDRISGSAEPRLSEELAEPGLAVAEAASELFVRGAGETLLHAGEVGSSRPAPWRDPIRSRPPAVWRRGRCASSGRPSSRRR